jgi:hypothetical protein
MFPPAYYAERMFAPRYFPPAKPSDEGQIPPERMILVPREDRFIEVPYEH